METKIFYALNPNIGFGIQKDNGRNKYLCVTCIFLKSIDYVSSNSWYEELFLKKDNGTMHFKDPDVVRWLVWETYLIELHKVFRKHRWNRTVQRIYDNVQRWDIHKYNGCLDAIHLFKRWNKDVLDTSVSFDRYPDGRMFQNFSFDQYLISGWRT